MTPSPKPQEAKTIFFAVDSGQEGPSHDTVEPKAEEQEFFSGDIDFTDNFLTAPEAGIGLFSAATVLLVILCSMMYGFHRGRKSEQSEESDFLRTLLDRVKITERN